MVVLAPSGEIIEASDAAVRGLARRLAVGARWSDVCCDAPERTREYLALCARTLEPVPGSFQVVMDGAPIRFRCDG
ncbi:MAG TPA: hypothetical protein VHV78_15990, partial [Gemmatimonadaceae bacterium]|nr:hypothetical protein [Gemmatimonadaceae bacterium]